MILASINEIALITRARVCLHLNDLGRQKLMPGNFACRNEQSVPRSSPPKKRLLPTNSLHHQDPSQCEDTYSDEFDHTYSLTTIKHRCQHSTKVYWNASCNTCFILFPGTRFLFFHRICRAMSSCPPLILLSLKRLSEPLKCTGAISSNRCTPNNPANPCLVNIVKNTWFWRHELSFDPSKSYFGWLWIWVMDKWLWMVMDG
jgi:hypothetical protein